MRLKENGRGGVASNGGLRDVELLVCDACTRNLINEKGRKLGRRKNFKIERRVRLWIGTRFIHHLLACPLQRQAALT